MVETSSAAEMWEAWVGSAYAKVDKNGFLGYLPKICLPRPNADEDPLAELETFDGPGPWDRTSLEIEVEDSQTLRTADGEPVRKKMLLFSGNDYLNLSSHPAVCRASAKAALAYGMGPRSSALVSGQTEYHRQLEILLAEMHQKKACIVAPTGFAANTAFFSTLGGVATHNAASKKLVAPQEKIAVFSDALNHASIIDGLCLMERHQQAVVYVYRHSDMAHLDEILSSCDLEKKVVITDSLFSMEGDFAPILELVQLREKHRFLLVVDEAHTAFVCGRNGGGICEVYRIQNQIDVIVGTLSKAGGCLGGFIACSEKWSNLIRCVGRSYIFTTASPLPIIAAAYTAAMVARKEGWRRQAVWNRVHEFVALTNHPATSPIVSLVVGDENAAILASKHMLEKGFHVTAIRPPAVSPDACRLRVTLTAAHTKEDLRGLVTALDQCIPGLVPQVDRVPARL
ncbi:8-amino-7-oxononanoate synthase-like [Wolffia australiana]